MPCNPQHCLTRYGVSLRLLGLLTKTVMSKRLMQDTLREKGIACSQQEVHHRLLWLHWPQAPARHHPTIAASAGHVVSPVQQSVCPPGGDLGGQPETPARRQQAGHALLEALRHAGTIHPTGYREPWILGPRTTRQEASLGQNRSLTGR